MRATCSNASSASAHCMRRDRAAPSQRARVPAPWSGSPLRPPSRRAAPARERDRSPLTQTRDDEHGRADSDEPCQPHRGHRSWTHAPESNASVFSQLRVLGNPTGPQLAGDEERRDGPGPPAEHVGRHAGDAVADRVEASRVLPAGRVERYIEKSRTHSDTLPPIPMRPPPPSGPGVSSRTHATPTVWRGCSGAERHIHRQRSADHVEAALARVLRDRPPPVRRDVARDGGAHHG